MIPVTQYFQFNDGAILLRQTRTNTGMGFRLIATGTNGQWRDDHVMGWRTHESQASEVTLVEAQEIAARLGGSLKDDGGLVSIGETGP